MKIEIRTNYIAPEISIFTVLSESVLCQSINIGGINEEDASDEMTWE